MNMSFHQSLQLSFRFFFSFQQLMRLEQTVFCVPSLQKVFLQISGPLSQACSAIRGPSPDQVRGHWPLSFLSLWSYLSTVSISFAATVCLRASSQLTWLCCLGALFGLLLRKLGHSHPGALCEKWPLQLGSFFWHSSWLFLRTFTSNKATWGHFSREGEDSFMGLF